MSCHNCLWLEFSGAAGEHALSEPFSYVRFIGDRIEGGVQRQLVAHLREDRWLAKPHQAVSFSRVAGLGVFSVCLEHLDGSTVARECTRVLMNGTLLIVDSWTVAVFERTRAAWVRLDTNTALHSIRLQANVAPGDILPLSHATSGESQNRVPAAGFAWHNDGAFARSR
jgi:hypothetical protein